jgi:hypothetical protein
MYQYDDSTAAASLPAPAPSGTPGYFTDVEPATLLRSDFMNMLMMELLNIIEYAGETPSKTTYNQVLTAIKSITGSSSTYGFDTGSANTYAVTYTPAVAAITDGLKLRFKAKTANTGTSTFSPNGLTAKAIVGAAHAALQGGEIVANGDIEVVWNSTLAAWVLLEQTGGGTQVATATKSSQAVNLVQLNAIPGVTNGSNAAAGTVGEFVTASAAAASITTATPTNLTSISLPPGDWKVWGVVQFAGSSNGQLTQAAAGISTTSSTLGTVGTYTVSNLTTGYPPSGETVASPVVRINISTTTTVFLVGETVFASGTATAAGYIGARRVR